MRIKRHFEKKEVSDLEVRRIRILFKGIVQGVGFRPFLYRSALKFELSGFVKNTARGVLLEVEGAHLDRFIRHILENPPPLSRIENHRVMDIPVENSHGFEIVSSEHNEQVDLLVSADIAICKNCRRELMTKQDRRYGYPFINCTDCGPRLTIIRTLPYDRPKTTMKKFDMCASCEKEYTDPADRRYHAQPVSCFQCGPVLNIPGDHSTDQQAIIDTASEKLKEGMVVAIKGLGGYHLACLASSDKPVIKVRKLKRRMTKPFALMGTMEMIRENCLVSAREKQILSSPSAPILLLEQKKSSNLSSHIAPGQNRIGFMLPYTPLHLLILKRVGEPLVMTSANYSGEPIIYRDDFEILSDLSDLVVSHNRDIHVFADDSVVRVFNDGLLTVRRSRGYVPLPIQLPFKVPLKTVGLGAMLKTSFAILFDDRAIVSQYIGNTDSPASIEEERILIRHYQQLFSFDPELVVLDKHPEYPNRILADDFNKSRVMEVQHHRAHVGSLLAEHGERGRILGISMDGTGFGDDGKIWGGEFFVGDCSDLARFGHLKYRLLPSGEQSIKEPWRFALSLLYDLDNDSKPVRQLAEKFNEKGKLVLDSIRNRINGIETSSCGRLFDAVAAILGIGYFSSYDGELPSLLQARAERSSKPKSIYAYSLYREEGYILDLLPAIGEMIRDRQGVPEKAFAFHNTLAHGFLEMAEKARSDMKIRKVGLTGGVFQNTLLLELTRNLLVKNRFEVLMHSEIPSNDNGIALGQAFLAAASYL
jgi:hydrogenase maturation protein HypF